MSLEITVEAEGEAEILDRLQTLRVRFFAEAQEALTGTAMLAAAEAKRKVIDGPKTGYIYDWAPTDKEDPRKTRMIYFHGHWFWIRPRTAPHQASAPWQAPATDTGTLAGSISAEPIDGTLGARIVARTRYATWLEYGTKYMAPRPFLRPAGWWAVKQAEPVYHDILNRLIRGE